jgi:hypothetical protein
MVPEGSSVVLSQANVGSSVVLQHTPLAMIVSVTMEVIVPPETAV